MINKVINKKGKMKTNNAKLILFMIMLLSD